MIDEFNETLEQLELLIGKENSKKVVDFFEGMNIYFPKRIGLNELHNQIYEELQSGATYHDLAVKYGYTKSYIRKIEHKRKEAERQKWQMRGGTHNTPVTKQESPIRLVPRERTFEESNNFEKGELFYGI